MSQHGSIDIHLTLLLLNNTTETFRYLFIHLYIYLFFSPFFSTFQRDILHHGNALRTFMSQHGSIDIHLTLRLLNNTNETFRYLLIHLYIFTHFFSCISKGHSASRKCIKGLYVTARFN